MLQKLCGFSICIFCGIALVLIKTDNSVNTIISNVLGYFMIFIAILIPFGKTEAELTPEEKAQMMKYDLNNIISTKLNDTFGAQNVENARKILDDISSNPFFRVLTLFMFRRKM